MKKRILLACLILAIALSLLPLTMAAKNVVNAQTVAQTEEENKWVSVSIQDENGVTADHSVRLNIDQMVLRASNKSDEGKAEPGLYFEHKFDGDDVVKKNVRYYGIAFSLQGVPTGQQILAEATRLGDKNSVVYKAGNVVFTKLENSQQGVPFGSDADSTSALITGIMKEESGSSLNEDNAKKTIYGVAYVVLANGDIALGVGRERSLQEQVEKVDEIWDRLSHEQRKSVLQMVRIPTFRNAVSGWTVPNMQNPEKAQADSEKQIFRVLSIGNSHTDNATEYLYNVFQAENPDKQVQIAQLYYSGCTVSQHLNFAQTNAAVYRYRTQDKRYPSNYATFREALSSEIWDVVILHEMNAAGGVESTYTGTHKRDLQNHINNIRRYSLNSDPKLIWNFSWANPTSEYLWSLGYPAGDNFSWVTSYQKNFGGDYEYMVDCMVNMTKKYVVTNENIQDVAPTGLAFEYARNNNPNKEDPDVLLYGDYTHAGPGFGRLLASYVWYATLMGKTELTELKYTRDLTADEQKLLLAAVNYALGEKEVLYPTTLENPETFSVGYAKTDITPSLDYELCLLGNGDESTRVATGVLENLYANCTVMSDEEDNTVILFALDIHGIYQELLYGVRRAVSRRLGIEGKYIQMTATHTHQAPPAVTDNDYPDSVPYMYEVIEKCADAAVQAMQDRKPATMSVGHTRVPDLNQMRYCYLEDGTLFSGYPTDEQAAFYGQAYRPDDLLQLVKFTREGGKDVALINWQGHYRGNPADKYTYYSSDFMGVLRNELLNQADCESMVIMGAGGDSVHSTQYPGLNNERNKTYETVGQTLATEAMSLLQASMTPADTGKVTLEENIFHIQTNKNDYNLYTFGIGDVGFCMMPYEPFQSLGMAVREQSPYKMTLIGTVANGYGGKAYLPDAAAYDSVMSDGKPGYGVSYRYVKGDEALFHEQYIQMLNKCFENGTTAKKEKAAGYIAEKTYADATTYYTFNATATAVKNGLYQVQTYVNILEKKVLLVASQEVAEQMANTRSFKVVMDNRGIVVGLQN